VNGALLAAHKRLGGPWLDRFELGPAECANVVQRPETRVSITNPTSSASTRREEFGTVEPGGSPRNGNSPSSRKS